MRTAVKWFNRYALLFMASALFMATAHAAGTTVLVVGKDKTTIDTVSVVLEAHGYNVKTAATDTSRPGMYVIQASPYFGGQRRGNGIVVVGGANTIIGLYHCSSDIDIYLASFEGGYWGVGPAYSVLPQINAHSQHFFLNNTDKLINSPIWRNAIHVCRSGH